MEQTALLKARAQSSDMIEETPFLEWNTCDILQNEVNFRMTQDDARKTIRRLKDRVYRTELPATIEDRMEKARQRIKEGNPIPPRFQNQDGTLNEVEARKELRKKEQEAIRGRIREQVEKELFSDASEDVFLFSDQYESLTEALTEAMKELPNYTGQWYINVSGFGWRSLDGEKTCTAEDGQRLLQEILPQTECTYRIFKLKDGTGFALQNFHHDSPTGNEWYKIIPLMKD